MWEDQIVYLSIILQKRNKQLYMWVYEEKNAEKP